MATVERNELRVDTPEKKLALRVLADAVKQGLYFHVGDRTRIKALYEKRYGPIDDEVFDTHWSVLRLLAMTGSYTAIDSCPEDHLCKKLLNVVREIRKLDSNSPIYFISAPELYSCYLRLCYLDDYYGDPISYDDFLAIRNAWAERPEILNDLPQEESYTVAVDEFEGHIAACINASFDAYDALVAEGTLPENWTVPSLIPIRFLFQCIYDQEAFEKLYHFYHLRPEYLSDVDYKTPAMNIPIARIIADELYGGIDWSVEKSELIQFIRTFMKLIGWV